MSFDLITLSFFLLFLGFLLVCIIRMFFCLLRLGDEDRQMIVGKACTCPSQARWAICSCLSCARSSMVKPSCSIP